MARVPAKALQSSFPFADAIHLIRGSSSGGTARQAGMRFVVAGRDTLAIGPSSSEPVEHGKLRAAFWGAAERGSLFSTAALHAAVRACPSHLPLVLWSGENWSDRLFLWWALDALSRSTLAHRPLWLASPLLMPGWNFLDSMGCYNPDQVKMMFGRARRLGPGAVKAASARWKHFCASTPRGLSKLATPEEPWLKINADYYRFFPSAKGRVLCISEFDEVVLSGFSRTSWRRPLEIISSGILRKHPVLFNHGDMLPLRRLEDWTMPRPLPALVRRATGAEAPSNRSDWVRYEYRLTAHGVHVLKHGLGSISWAPLISMGGHAAYDPKRPWVVRETRGGWKLRPWR